MLALYIASLRRVAECQARAATEYAKTGQDRERRRARNIVWACQEKITRLERAL